MKLQTTYVRPELHTYLDATLTDLHHHRILTTLMNYFGLRPGDAVIEIGSGSGRYTEWLLRYGLHVTAVEPDPQLIGKLERRLEGARQLRVLQSDISAAGSSRRTPRRSVDSTCSITSTPRLWPPSPMPCGGSTGAPGVSFLGSSWNRIRTAFSIRSRF